MTIKLTLASLALLGTTSLHAAGVTWSYDGRETYDAALIVWTDEGINSDSPEVDVAVKRVHVFEQLADASNSVTLANLVTLCERKTLNDVIQADLVKPVTDTFRVSHGRLYLIDRTGWGFTLLVRLDADGIITEYAINEITAATIISAAVVDTQLVIHDEALTPGVSAAAQERLRLAGAPFIVHHSPHGPPGNEQTPTSRAAETSPETFLFDITNAVNGFTYHVVSAVSPENPFEPCGVDIFAKTDGRLSFEVPIDPKEQIKYYRVEVADLVSLRLQSPGGYHYARQQAGLRQPGR